jgi:hypothetical protein
MLRTVKLTDSLTMKGVSVVIQRIQYIWINTRTKGMTMRISSSRSGVYMMPQRRSYWTPKVLKVERTAVRITEMKKVAT